MGSIGRVVRRWWLVAGMGCAAGLISWGATAQSAATEGAGDVQQGKKTPAKAQGATLSGRVVTPDGKPVKGATVSWVGRPDREAVVLATVVTDEAGRFVFPNAAPLRGKDAYPRFMVEAVGWGLSFREAPLDDELLEIELVPPTELRVNVLDREGKPVPDLLVRPGFFVGGRHSVLNLPQTVAERLGRRTDPQGRITIAGLPQGHQVRLAVADERFATLSYDEQIRLDAGPVTQARPVHLLPGASIRGRIAYGPTGKSAPGIRVGAQSVPESNWGEAVTAADGSYELKQLRPGAYNVALDLQGDVARSWTAPAHELVPVAAGERLEGKDFRLIPGAIIRGKVTAADNGQPVAGLDIGVYGPAHPRSGAWVGGAKSGPDGTYAVRVPGGKQYLYIAMAALPGYVLPEQSGRDVAPQDGETLTVDFRLARGTTARPVQGRVVGPDGRSIAGAEIVGTPVGRFGPDPVWMRADAEGRFRLSERSLAEPVALRARHQAMATTSATLVTGGEEVTLRLEKDALVSLSGRVTDAEGKPLAGAQVRLTQ
jgi:protocatechuate 3,4-dioxygenase beta subunit